MNKPSATAAVGLSRLFERDLGRLSTLLTSLPSDDVLWKVLPGVTNSIGNLTLHLEGNLREFVGRQLGGVRYQRARPLEFSTTGLSKDELVVRVEALAELIPRIITAQTPEQLEAIYPENVLGTPMPTGEFLLHLYGHLNYHFGQINYLSRILTAA